MQVIIFKGQTTKEQEDLVGVREVYNPKNSNEFFTRASEALKISDVVDKVTVRVPKTLLSLCVDLGYEEAFKIFNIPYTSEEEAYKYVFESGRKFEQVKV